MGKEAMELELQSMNIIQQTLVPPEFVALIPSTPQEYQIQPVIVGYTFQLHNGCFYSDTYGVCLDRKKAYRYAPATVAIVSRMGGWGHKSRGKFRAVYEEKSV